MDTAINNDEVNQNKRTTNLGDATDLLIEEGVDEHPVSRLPVTSYRMKPTVRELFPASEIKRIIQATVYDKLQGKIYSPDEARKWTQEISDEVCLAVRERMQMPRFKHVVQLVQYKLL